MRKNNLKDIMEDFNLNEEEMYKETEVATSSIKGFIADDDLFDLDIEALESLDDDEFETNDIFANIDEEEDEEILEEALDKAVSMDEEDELREPLTPEEQKEIAENNLALIHYVISKLNNPVVATYDELVSVGMVGFTKALVNFNKRKKVKFSTYAINCIKNEILYFLRKENKHCEHNTSLNTVLSTDKNGNNLQLEETLSEDEIKQKSLEDLILEEENRNILLEAMRHLKEEEQFILIYRFGLDKGIIKTQKEIADSINMSQANVSKIQKNCLNKLRLILRKEMP